MPDAVRAKKPVPIFGNKSTASEESRKPAGLPVLPMEAMAKASAEAFERALARRTVDRVLDERMAELRDLTAEHHALLQAYDLRMQEERRRRAHALC